MNTTAHRTNRRTLLMFLMLLALPVPSVTGWGNTTAQAAAFGSHVPPSGNSVSGVATDGMGNVWVTGIAIRHGTYVTNGIDYGYDSRVYVTKYNASGTPVFTIDAGFGTDFPFRHGTPSNSPRIAADGMGNAWVTNGGDALMKYRADGAPVFTKNLCNSSSNCASIADLAVDASGAVWLTGNTSRKDFPVTDGSLLVSDNDGFVARYRADGSEEFATFVGGGRSYGEAITIDGAGNAWVTGPTYSKAFPATNGSTKKVDSGATAFVLEYSARGARLFATYLGGSGSMYPYGVAADTSGNIWVTGSTESSDFPVTNGSRPTHGDNTFVAKYDMHGTLAFATYLDSNRGIGIAASPSGDVWLLSNTDIQISSPDSSLLIDTQQGVVTQYGANGAVAVAAEIGGNGSYATAVAADPMGDIWIVGNTTNAHLPVTDGSMRRGGTYDAFLAKYDTRGTLRFGTYLVGGYGTTTSNTGIPAST